jgi:hypothetical protein
MRRDIIAALRLSLSGHLSLRTSRLESFCVLVVGVLLSRTVNLTGVSSSAGRVSPAIIV